MHSLTVFQSYHAQVFAQFRDENPMADPSVGLKFATNRLTQCLLAPLTLEVRTFP